MAGVKLIHHVNVPTSDRERTRDWYEKVLGAEYLDRGPINSRQLQMRIGTGEMHFSDTPNPSQGGHFAVEVDDWEGTISNLEKLGVAYSRSPGSEVGPTRSPEDDQHQGRREDNGEHFTYIRDPDGNVIELVYHPLGLEDAEHNQVGLADHTKGLRWRQKAGFIAPVPEFLGAPLPRVHRHRGRTREEERGVPQPPVAGSLVGPRGQTPSVAPPST